LINLVKLPYNQNEEAGIAQLVERRTENPCVTSSSLVPSTFTSVSLATWPSGKAIDCKSFTPQFESGCRLWRILDLVVNLFQVSYLYLYLFFISCF